MDQEDSISLQPATSPEGPWKWILFSPQTWFAINSFGNSCGTHDLNFCILSFSIQHQHLPSYNLNDPIHLRMDAEFVWNLSLFEDLSNNMVRIKADDRFLSSFVISNQVTESHNTSSTPPYLHSIQSLDTSLEPWFVPIIFGFVQIDICHLTFHQEFYSSYGSTCDEYKLALVSRRSRYRAGALRFYWHTSRAALI